MCKGEVKLIRAKRKKQGQACTQERGNWPLCQKKKRKSGGFLKCQEWCVAVCPVLIENSLGEVCLKYTFHTNRQKHVF